MPVERYVDCINATRLSCVSPAKPLEVSVGLRRPEAAPKGVKLNSLAFCCAVAVAAAESAASAGARCGGCRMCGMPSAASESSDSGMTCGMHNIELELLVKRRLKPLHDKQLCGRLRQRCNLFAVPRPMQKEL